MLHGKKTRRVVATTLLVVMLSNILTPTIGYALTSGPTAPEATSFEPVDTTDMVNLQTGDFTYNIPLMEVPGPEGGYPLSLSYHAGIQTNEDASWVGLGWTLNPGAISRSVNGYPDDWYSPTNSSHVYWSGGSTSSYNIGVSIGLANSPASVNFGLSFSQDTYRGFGMGFSFGVGGRLFNSPFSASIGVGLSPYGGGYVGGSLGVAAGKGLTASLGINLSTNFESLNAGVSGNIGYSMSAPGQEESMSGSLLGASISTGANKPSFEVSGLTTNTSSSSEAQIQTSSKGFSLDIPVWYGVNVSLGYNKTRYWTDERTDVHTHGSLYSSGWGERTENPYEHAMYDNQAFDSYSLLEDPGYKNMVDNPDPQKVQGGAYLDFDVYSVNAQGLGGNMRPYLFQGEVLGQNKKKADGTQIVTYYSPGVTHSQPQFRFVGDFSNSYRQAYDPYPDPTLNLRSIEDLPFDANPVYGNNDGNYGYGGGNNLAGSRHIDVGVKIQPTNALGYIKADRYLNYMIDGFSITNESGVTYHFGLPAYAWDEEVYQERISRANGFHFNRSSKPNAYAYTWYLTTITGPDFVDRNSDGKAGSGDWGYWINFEYGKASDNYTWRNPSEGYHRDEDNEWQTCSMGKKEVYYLNTIRTRTHVALFSKIGRLDGRGESQMIYNKNSDGSYTYPGLFNGSGAESMQLAKIYLLNAAEYGSVNFNDNIFHQYDISLENGVYTLDQKAIRIIEFEYDNLIVPETANSYFFDMDRTGKLKLTSVKFRGRKGVGLLPAVKFDYDLSGDDLKTATGSLSPGSFVSTSNAFEVGDLLGTNDSWIYDRIYCGVIVSKTQNGSNYTYTLKNGVYSGGTITKELRTTKNPAYHKDAYDSWGMFKSDYDVGLININENAGRTTSPISVKSVDAWCLRKITSALGAEVNIRYEGKEYQKAVLVKNQSGVIQSFQKLTGTTFKINMLGTDVDLRRYFNTGNTIDALILKQQSLLFQGQDPQPIGYSITRTPDWSPQPVIIGAVNQSDMTLQTSEAMMTHIFESVGTYVEGVPAALTNAAMSGNLNLTPTNSPFNGGGIRVKSIELNTLENVKFITSFDYKVPGQNLSSGITSYEPVTLEIDNVGQMAEDAKKLYRRELYKNASYLYSIARELPAPCVIYEYVTVTKQVKNSGELNTRQIEGKTQYQFEVFRDNMVGRIDVASRTDHTNAWGHFTTRNVALKKFMGSIGKLKRTIQFDKDGNKLTETINHYLHDGLEALPLDQFMEQYNDRLLQFNYQGFLQERNAEVKVVDEQGWNSNSQVMATLSAREDYPCIATGQTVINYMNGTRTNSETLGFDFYSGAITKSVQTDVYGNRFMTEVIPAYRKYPSLGLKMNSANNKHMLSQTTGKYTYTVDGSNNKLGLATADITTWSNAFSAMDINGTSYVQNNVFANGDVWRIQSSYSWVPDNKTSNGLTAIGNFIDFNWANPAAADVSWKKSSEITLYDTYSKSLEAKDINNNYTATHMGYNSGKVVLTGGPVKYYEIASSGAEDNNGLVLPGDGSRVSGIHDFFHTGHFSLLLGAGGNRKGFIYTISTDKLVAGRDYVASVWVKADGFGTATTDVKLYYDINGVQKGVSISSGTSTKVSDGFRLITLKINGTDITGNPGDIFSVWCRNDDATVYAHLDDFRFQPLNAAVTGYVYDAFTGELTSMLDKNNMYTRFEYDEHGRLRKVFKENFRAPNGSMLAEEYDYNYAAGTRFECDYIDADYVKQCPAGQFGTSVHVNVFPSQFLSNISKADANKKAQAYAQAYANQQGTCVAPGVYAKLEFQSAQFDQYSNQYESYTAQYVDIYVSFYSDPQCNNPITLSNSVSINIHTAGCIDYLSSYNCYQGDQSFSIPSGVDSYKIYDLTSLFGEWIVYDENMEITYLERWGDHYELQASPGISGVGAPVMYISTPPWW
jgi:hypothetical protein